MSQSARRIYDADFKKETLSLSRETGKTKAEVERSLGIPFGSIGRWKRQLETKGSLAFPGHGKEALTPDQRRIRELEKQLRDSNLERDILKKAVGIFSGAPK